MAQLVWLITGCSSGFGEQFVHCALARGDKVIATGRNAATRLKHLEGTGAAIVDLDVSLSEPEIKKIVGKSVQIYGQIDVLVNNAGSPSFGLLEEFTNEDYRKIFDVNFFGCLAVTRAVLPHMRARQSGTIAFIGSGYGNWSPPGFTPYASAKHALEGIADGLRMELAPFNIRVTIFEPGYFLTNFAGPGKAVVPDSSRMLEAYASQHEMIFSAAAGVMGQERGEPKKAVDRMVDVVRGEGCADGKKFPPRLPIGPDSLRLFEKKCRETLRLIEAWRKQVEDTDREGYEEKPGSELLLHMPDYDI